MCFHYQLNDKLLEFPDDSVKSITSGRFPGSLRLYHFRRNWEEYKYKAL